MENLYCPKWNSKDIKRGVIGSSFGKVKIFPENIRSKSSSISAGFCNECGYIASLYVDHPTNVES